MVVKVRAILGGYEERPGELGCMGVLSGIVHDGGDGWKVVEVVLGVVVAAAEVSQQGSDVAILATMECVILACKLLWEVRRFGNEQMMKGASFTQGTISSISIGGSISFEGFLSSILLSVVERMHSTRTGHHWLRIVGNLHGCSLCFLSGWYTISIELLDGAKVMAGGVMYHDSYDEDGDSDANDGDDDEREIS
ncbi:hypothetical protein Tco_0682247 [Tanacetum coccineum]|uniref:Uncharacterized protein n=1 Tax=Tanacetum coccineum TaxID=301880 RepID=A0ABQ4XQM2_9ASTR